MWPSPHPSCAEQGCGRRRLQASQLALAGKVWSIMYKHTRTTAWTLWIFWWLLSGISSPEQMYSTQGWEMEWMCGVLDHIFKCSNGLCTTLLRFHSSQTAVGAGGTSVEAFSSLLTGSSLLHTASSMALGKAVAIIKLTMQHVLFERLTNIGEESFGRVFEHSCLCLQIYKYILYISSWTTNKLTVKLTVSCN